MTNDVVILTNVQGFVTGRHFDTNTFHYTVNDFQFYDIELTNGVNLITLRVSDLAGNVTVTNLAVTLDYSGDTNGPLIQVVWPWDGAIISGDSFTLRGMLDDETASAWAWIVGTNSVTNVVEGIVERDGRLWIEELPLAAGSNLVTLTAMDAAGN